MRLSSPFIGLHLSRVRLSHWVPCGHIQLQDSSQWTCLWASTLYMKEAYFLWQVLYQANERPTRHRLGVSLYCLVTIQSSTANFPSCTCRRITTTSSRVFHLPLAYGIGLFRCFNCAPTHLGTPTCAMLSSAINSPTSLVVSNFGGIF